MELLQLCKLNEIVSRINSQKDAETLLKDFEFNYIKYYKDNLTDAECVVVDDEYHNIKHFIFKGTDSVKDWKSNMDFYPVSISPGHPDFKIHRGFFEQWLSLSSWLKNEVEKDNEKQLVISGHSLGGAIAIICAIYMYCISDTLVKRVCTFGAPRCLCKDMTKWYNSHLKTKTIRVLNSMDTIPKLPLPGPILEYCHVDAIKFEFKFGCSLIADNLSSTHLGNIFYCYKKIIQFVRGMMLRSEPHLLTTYVEYVEAFTFFTQFPIY